VQAQAAEDASWNDGGGKVDKNASKLAKREEELQRKKERDALEEAETATATKKKNEPPKKKTQFELMALLNPPKKKEKPKKEEPLERNINHVRMEEAAAAGNAMAASGVDGATALLQQLKTGADAADDKDANPERRRKAAFKAYEEREIPRMREENPGLKLSQIKERIFQAWQKSPENPLNQE